MFLWFRVVAWIPSTGKCGYLESRTSQTDTNEVCMQGAKKLFHVVLQRFSTLLLDHIFTRVKNQKKFGSDAV